MCQASSSITHRDTIEYTHTIDGMYGLSSVVDCLHSYNEYIELCTWEYKIVSNTCKSIRRRKAGLFYLNENEIEREMLSILFCIQCSSGEND